MGTIRPFRDEDAESVAALFQRIFRRGGASDCGALADYLLELYKNGPTSSAEIPSLVHISDRGILSGFIGLNTLSMRWHDRPLKVALCSTVMVDPTEKDALAAAKLMKAARTGSQDFSFSETASDVSLRMLRTVGGKSLPQHSFDWVRFVSPATAAVEMARRRLPMLTATLPIAKLIDRRLRARRQRMPRWLAMPNPVRPPAGFETRAIDPAEFAGIFLALTARFAVRPDWSAEEIARLVREAMAKPAFGTPVLAAVYDRNQRPAGAFLYHVRENGTARVIQMVASEHQTGAVLDALIADAAGRGASVVRGRTQPFMMNAILTRRIPLFNVASSAYHCREPELAAVLANGDCFLNGLVGEQWSRLIGDFR
ncbi:MAG: hypothetical protein PW791_14940 [Neorhizobium sp.]|jgi:hypothetical protein|nr:hypothetical protein [Neorhizobium sp.]